MPSKESTDTRFFTGSSATLNESESDSESELVRLNRSILCLLVALASACSGPQRTLPPPSVEPPSVQPPTVAPPLATRAETTFVLHAVDVGTGLALLVEAGDFALVYDAGSNDDLATGPANRFVAYLKAAKPHLKVIDHIVLSHPHRDHVELLPDVFATYEVKEVWDSGAINPICGYRKFVDALGRERGLVYRTATNGAGEHAIAFPKNDCGAETSLRLRHGEKLVAGTTAPLGPGASMTVLHADAAHHETYNANSLVVRLDLAGTRVLLMGDAEAGGRSAPSVPPTRGSIEGKLLECCRKELDADVLVVAHHGSKSSSRSRFLDAVTPKISVISSGPTRYATVTLPDAEIVKELARYGQVFRTDIDDAACAVNTRKVGPDADGRPGGCDNVLVTVHGGGRVEASYARGAD